MSDGLKLYQDKLLRDAYEKQGIPLRDIYRDTGVAVNTIRRALAGSDTVTAGTLYRLAQYFRIDWTELHRIEGGAGK